MTITLEEMKQMSVSIVGTAQGSHVIMNTLSYYCISHKKETKWFSIPLKSKKRRVIKKRKKRLDKQFSLYNKRNTVDANSVYLIDKFDLKMISLVATPEDKHDTPNT